MKTVEIKLYKFDELSKEAQQKAIKKTRESYYCSNDFSLWAIDDCSLLEPPHDELHNLFGNDYDFPLIKNNRNVYFSLERNRYIDISNAMEIQDSNQFLKWLGLDKRLIDKIDYSIGSDTISFHNQSNNDFTNNQEEKLKLAVEKFENHCEDILNRLEQDIEYRYSDECIIEDLLDNNYYFRENGDLYY